MAKNQSILSKEELEAFKAAHPERFAELAQRASTYEKTASSQATTETSNPLMSTKVLLQKGILQANMRHYFIHTKDKFGGTHVYFDGATINATLEEIKHILKVNH